MEEGKGRRRGPKAGWPVITCRDCGRAEDLEWAYAKDGKPYLVQVRRIPHLVLCPAKKGKKAPRRSRNGAKPARDAVAESAMMLREMNYTKAEAADMLKDIPEAAPEAMIVAALKRKGEG